MQLSHDRLQREQASGEVFRLICESFEETRLIFYKTIVANKSS